MNTQNPLYLQLINAIIENNVDVVNNLLNAGVDPNECLDTAKITPLHYAAQNNALHVIPLLIEAGADLHAVTEPDELTPLEIALMHGHDKVVQILLAYSSDTDAKQH